MLNDDAVERLRAAVAASPDNVTLVELLADTLLTRGRPDEAEVQYQRALALDPTSASAKVGLSRVSWQQGKADQALVILEDVLKDTDVPRARALYASILGTHGEAERAVAEYQRAIAADPTVRSPEFEAQFGIEADENAEIVGGRVRARADAAFAQQPLAAELPRITFADVGGMEAVKDAINLKIVGPLQHPELYRAYGKTAGGGILLYGPPGCGKTYLARATAGEIGAGFIAVGISDVLDMWLGNSERNLHDVFEVARRNKPCVLFFDEVDALGASRTDQRLSSARHVINQFLAEMDGVQSSNEGVLVLAATNAPWHVDTAFRRPGRFDRMLFVPPPDPAARTAILRIHMRDRIAGDVDFDRVAKKTDGFSGADLRAVVDGAVESKLRAAMRSGAPQPLTTNDLIAAAGSLRPTAREWFATARNYVLYANEGGTYDEVRSYLKL